jgi:hypothetical protein
MGALSRSNLMLFVLVLVLVLVLGDQNFIEDEGRERGRRRSPYFATACGSSRKWHWISCSFTRAEKGKKDVSTLIVELTNPVRSP